LTSLLTPSSGILLETLSLAQLDKKIPEFREPESSLSYSQESSPGRHFETELSYFHCLPFIKNPSANCAQIACNTLSVMKPNRNDILCRLFSTFAVTTQTCRLVHGEGWDRVNLLRRPVIGLLYYDDNERGAVSGIKIGRGNRSSWRKSATVTLCPPQILTWRDLGPNSDSRGEKVATVHLSYGTARPSLSLATRGNTTSGCIICTICTHCVLHRLPQPTRMLNSARTRLNVSAFHNVIITQCIQNDVFHPNCCAHLPYMTLWTDACIYWSVFIVLLWSPQRFLKYVYDV
jgi:hypothetical protein